MTAVVQDAPCYVFGIVPAGQPVPTGGGQGLAADVRVVEQRGLGAVVAGAPTDRPLGTAADLLDHDRVLAAIAVSGTPVLPMRFGSVLTDEDAVSSELLEPHHDEFLAALDRVRGCLQYTVTVRYEEDAAVREVLAHRPDIRRLQGRSLGESEAAFKAKLQLGSAIVSALAELRPAAEAGLMSALANYVDIRTHDVTSPEVVLQGSFLVRSDDIEAFERSVEQVGQAHVGRMRVRLAGPSPAYDFVGGD